MASNVWVDHKSSRGRVAENGLSNANYEKSLASILAGNRADPETLPHVTIHRANLKSQQPAKKKMKKICSN